MAAILADVLPSGTVWLPGSGYPGRRVSWPLVARATGLGEIEGGELVLVPAARAADVVRQLADLVRAGVAGVIFEHGVEVRGEVGLSLALLPPGESVRPLQPLLERYITRRRRELFALDHEMHRGAVDPAISGLSIEGILERVAATIGMPVAVDRDGQILSAGMPVESLPRDLLLQLRIALRSEGNEPATFSGPPFVTALAIVAGRERRGIALIVGQPDNVDDAAVAVSALASAVAIALSRQADTQVPALDAWLRAAGGGALRTVGAALVCAAIADPEMQPRQLERSIRLEFEARGVEAALTEYSGRTVVVLPDVPPAQWGAIVDSLRARTGSALLRIGVGRPGAFTDGAVRSAQQAIDALALSREPVVDYRDVEVQALLRGTPAWRAYALDRLGGLVEERSSGGELFETLRAYLRCGRNAMAAAQNLHVHRNTLLYRLKRIEDVLRLDLSDPETLFQLELAVHAFEAGT